MRILAVGRVRDSRIAALCDDFLQRLRPYHRVEIVEVRASTRTDALAAVDDEARALARALRDDEQVWLLERSGEELTSEELAARLQALAVGGTSRVAFVVAGTYGAGPALLALADVRWSLSRLTFLHEWARALVLEQLYRATKIAQNEPYHH